MVTHWPSIESENHRQLALAVKRTFQGRKDDADKYLDRLLSACQDIAKTARKSMLFLIVTIVVFELFNLATVEKITLSFLDLKDPTAIVVFLPTVAAFFQYQAIRHLLHWRRIERVYSAVMQQVYPLVSINELENYLVPTVPLMSVKRARSAPFSHIVHLQDRLEGLFATVSSIALPLFQVYAYHELLIRYHRLTPMLITAASLTLALTICYCMVLWLLAKDFVAYRLYRGSQRLIYSFTSGGKWLLGGQHRIKARTALRLFRTLSSSATVHLRKFTRRPPPS